jgi:hypothetical protein
VREAADPAAASGEGLGVRGAAHQEGAGVLLDLADEGEDVAEPRQGAGFGVDLD